MIYSLLSHRRKCSKLYRSTRFSLSLELTRLTRDGTAEPVSRDQIHRRERGQGDIHFSCSADESSTIEGGRDIR